jgi:hypothetical protein
MVASVFYNRSSWHNLLHQVVNPFINTHTGTVENWCIYLSSVQGEHITFATRSSSDAQLQRSFYDMTESFLSKNPSEKKETSYPLNILFIDYPNNSIQFNKSKALSDSWNDCNQRNKRQDISQVMMYALAHDQIDKESIYTLMIYMQMGIIKAAYPELQKACCHIPDLLHYYKKVKYTSVENLVSKNESAAFLEMFENNKEILSEIIQDVWSENRDSELHWISAWISSCGDLILKSNFEQTFFILSNLICEHFGLNDEAMVRLSCQLLAKGFGSLPQAID